MEIVESHKEFIAIVLTVSTIVIGIWQYLNKQKQVVLSEYNQRYNTDVVIRKVVEYLSEDTNKTQPNTYEIELFFRFYEEIELGIERGVLRSKDVYNLFAYYCMYGLEKGLLTDYPTHWMLLRKFQKRMSPCYQNNNRTNCYQK